MSLNAIIFGSSGQDSFYLNQILNKQDISTVRVSRKGVDLKGDISDTKFVYDLIKKYKPKYIFHLAATSSVNREFSLLNHESISKGTLNILEGVYGFSKESKVFITGSAEQFKFNCNPISEQTEFYPNNSYAVERIYSSYLARYYRNKIGLRVYTGFLFHHDSPLRKENHLSMKIINFVKNLNENKKEKLKIGDPNVEKEFNYAEDIMHAVWKLINQENIFEAVIGSGKPYKIEYWLDLCFKKRGLNWKDWVEIDINYNAPYKSVFSDPTLIKSLGWKPKYDIEQLVNLMFDYDVNL